MRKMFICVILVLALIPFSFAQADEKSEQTIYTSGKYQYIILEDGTAEIYKFTGKAGTLNIPSNLDGIKVSSIGDSAFELRSIDKVIIPEGITNIGNRAFCSCLFLESVTIPEGLICIGDSAFKNCVTLKSVNIPGSVSSIGVNPFEYCGKLKMINMIPDHPCFAILDGVLFSKADRRLISYPKNYANDSYIIPQGIEIIGKLAFSGSALISVTIPDSVKLVEDNPFSGSKIISFIISDNHPYLEFVNGVLFSKPDKRLICFPCSSSNESYEIPQGTETIAERAFYYAKNLVSVIISDSVVSIGEEAFGFCTNLNSVIFSDGVAGIGNRAFEECENMVSITLPDSISSIGINPFYRCVKLSEIVVSPDHPYLAVRGGALYINEDNCLISYPVGSGISSYEISQGTQQIGDYAFYLAQNLLSVIIPDSVINIGEKAFGECDQLTLTVSHSSYAEQYCQVNSLIYTYPDSIDWLNP